MRKHINSKENNRWIRFFGFILCICICIFNFTPCMKNIRSMPDAIFAEKESDIEKMFYGANGLSFETVSSGNLNETLSEKYLTVKLFGLINIKTIPIYVGSRDYVHPCGDAIGISIHTKGLLVVGNGSFTDSGGRKCSPSEDAGIRPGDIIVSINGIEVNSSSEMQEAVEAAVGTADIVIERNSERILLTVQPVTAADGRLKIGAWVRDSTIGIGTLSFVDTQTGYAAALGHAVIDADTGNIIKVGSGEMRRASIVGVKKGLAGNPGELQGSFDSSSELIGSIRTNGEFGIYGVIEKTQAESMADYIVPVAFPNEVKKGDAYILASIENGKVGAYSCKVVKTVRQSEAGQKGMVIEVTDERLLDKAGGIVQGMSGSPIIQDGMLIGVVTHVFVNDPTKGYAIYAYWMQEF